MPTNIVKLRRKTGIPAGRDACPAAGNAEYYERHRQIRHSCVGSLSNIIRSTRAQPAPLSAITVCEPRPWTVTSREKGGDSSSTLRNPLQQPGCPRHCSRRTVRPMFHWRCMSYQEIRFFLTLVNVTPRRIRYIDSKKKEAGDAVPDGQRTMITKCRDH